MYSRLAPLCYGQHTLTVPVRAPLWRRKKLDRYICHICRFFATLLFVYLCICVFVYFLYLRICVFLHLIDSVLLPIPGWRCCQSVEVYRQRLLKTDGEPTKMDNNPKNGDDEDGGDDADDHDDDDDDDEDNGDHVHDHHDDDSGS